MIKVTIVMVTKTLWKITQTKTNHLRPNFTIPNGHQFAKYHCQPPYRKMTQLAYAIDSELSEKDEVILTYFKVLSQINQIKLESQRKILSFLNWII